MTSIDWSRTLLADDSNDALSLWADWLEDQGDEAARGVRELLVGQHRRPRGDTGSMTWIAWWCGDVRCYTNNLPKKVFKRLAHQTTGMNVNYGLVGDAAAHYAALLDASRAYLASLSPLATQTREKV